MHINVNVIFSVDNSLDILIENLGKLWQTFVTSISSSVSDYLSVEHLALILKRLDDNGMFLSFICSV